MSDNKYKIKDFSALIGCVPKTIYDLIKKEELLTVNEVINGRKVMLVIPKDGQIEELQKIYGKLPVNDGNYEDILTVNNSNETEETEEVPTYSNVSDNTAVDKLITLTGNLSSQLMKYNDELITAKSQQLLLEDKAGREGLYLQEIKDVKKEKDNIIKWSIIIVSVLATLVIVLIGLLVFLK